MNEQDENLIGISPLARQFSHRKLATYMESSDGSDLYFLVEAIRIVIADIKAREIEFNLTDKEEKTLKLVGRESAKILSYLEDTDIDKLDIEHPKFKGYQNALMNIDLVQQELFDIAFKVFSRTNLIHMTVHHTYLMEERKKKRHFEPERQDIIRQQMEARELSE